MILLETQNTPIWTDIVQSIGIALGIPLAIWSIFKLFIRDKKREAEVNSLMEIAKSQDKVITEMRNQLEEFHEQTQIMERQSMIMMDSNDLLKMQIDMQTKAMVYDLTFKENSLNYEVAKRKSDNKPYFIFYRAHGISHKGEFSVVFKNIGKTAYFKKVLDEKNHPVLNIPYIEKEDTKIEKDNTITIKGNIKDLSKNISTTDFEFTFEYTDLDGIIYRQTYSQIKNGSNHIVGTPIEIDKEENAIIKPII